MTRRFLPDDLVTTDDIRSRMEELELDHTDDDGELTDVGLWDESPRKEYRGLVEVIEAVCGDNERDSVTLIHENHFEQHIRNWYADTYAGQYHEQTREGMARLSWDDIMSRPPFDNIDWKAVAADEWSAYSQLEIDGVTYLHEVV